MRKTQKGGEYLGCTPGSGGFLGIGSLGYKPKELNEFCRKKSNPEAYCGVLSDSSEFRCRDLKYDGTIDTKTGKKLDVISCRSGTCKALAEWPPYTQGGGKKTARKSLEKYTVSELKEKAKSKKIIGYSKMLKAELITAIRALSHKSIIKKIKGGDDDVNEGYDSDNCNKLCEEGVETCLQNGEKYFCIPNEGGKSKKLKKKTKK